MLNFKAKALDAQALKTKI